MRILYVNHTSLMSGAEASMLELISGLPANVSAAVACPPGKLAVAATNAGLPVYPIAGTEAGLLSHGVGAFKSTREMAASAINVAQASRRVHADLVHANSIRAALITGAARWFGAAPYVAHIRDCLPSSRTANRARRAISRTARVVVANSRFTAENFSHGGRGKVRVVHNPVDLRRFDPDAISRAEARRSLGIADEAEVLTVIGQISPWKAQRDAIDVVGRLRAKRPHLVLLMVGSVKFTGSGRRFDNEAYLAELHQQVRAQGLEGAVRFLGEREDVPAVLRAADVNLVPSWEEPFGRTVIEAMAMRVPVVATSVGGPAEVIDDGVDGFILAPRNPDLWAEVVNELLESSSRRSAVTEAARKKVVAGYSIASHVAQVLEVYGVQA